MLAIGKQVAGLEVVAHIGRGGFADVYRVRRLSDGAALALKWFRAEHAHPELLARFRQEARIQRSLRHPNIVAVLDLLELPEGTGMVMPLYPDGSLDAHLAARPGEPMPPPQLRALFGPLLRALHHAHSKGIIHRDIKPENILLRADADGVLHGALSDFGIAQVRGARMTQDGQRMGTIEYMSPEQQRNPRDIDHRSDIYAMGVVIFECAARALPDERPDAFDALWARDPALAEVLRVALQPLPAMRFADCGELARALDAPASDLAARVRDLEVALQAFRHHPPAVAPPPPAADPPLLLAVEVVVVPLGGALLAAGSSPLWLTLSLMAIGTALIAVTAAQMWRGARTPALADLLPMVAGGVVSVGVVWGAWPADAALGAALAWGLVPTALVVARLGVGLASQRRPAVPASRKTTLDVEGPG